MKNSNIIYIFLVLVSSLIFTSCETTDLDLLDDPTSLTTDQVELNRLMNQIQLDFNSFVRLMANNGGDAVRISSPFGRTYNDAFSSTTLDTEWSLAYEGMFSDMKIAEELAINAGANKHVGVMKILKAYTYLILVDYLGDIPFSQATQPVEFPSPIADPGENVYAGLLSLIDEGISFLNMGGEDIENDFFYNNDVNKWKKAANTFKMVAYLNSGNLTEFNNIVNSGNFISATSDDMQFTYGTSTSPDTRHPLYADDYTVNGAGNYQSNWLMNEMLTSNDPRRRYYFHRQFPCTPGASCEPGGDIGFLTCSVTAPPSHYPASMVYCYVEDGYWGRDHLNAEGIPPDTFKRTATGVYPAGGLFDDADVNDSESFETVSVGAGGGGAGINPIMLASWVDLMRAEVALASNNASGAATFMQSGMQKSINKVASFISLDSSADSSMEPTSSDINNYINNIISSFNGGSNDDKWEILAKQVFVSQYGAGIAAYNFYRRTGYPHTLQFALDANPGVFVRSFFYSANEANTNSNIEQKGTLGVQVFWDTNPASPSFPEAN